MRATNRVLSRAVFSIARMAMTGIWVNNDTLAFGAARNRAKRDIGFPTGIYVG